MTKNSLNNHQGVLIPQIQLTLSFSLSLSPLDPSVCLSACPSHSLFFFLSLRFPWLPLPFFPFSLSLSLADSLHPLFFLSLSLRFPWLSLSFFLSISLFLSDSLDSLSFSFSLFLSPSSSLIMLLISPLDGTNVCIEQINVSFYWSANTSMSMCRSSFENVVCKFIFTFSVVHSMFLFFFLGWFLR